MVYECFEDAKLEFRREELQYFVFQPVFSSRAWWTWGFKVTTLREYRITRIELLKRGIFFSLSLELPCIPRLKVASSITGSSGFLARSSEVAMYQKLMRLSVPGIRGLRVPRLWLKGYRRHDDLIPVQSVTRS